MFLYNLFISIYELLLHVAALFVPKARAWRDGRSNWDGKLLAMRTEGRWIWMHCASAGELEQGKPVLEALRKNYPDHKLLLSFFSPSGYEVGVNYKGVDAVTYLPLDRREAAARFVSIVNPELVIFIKYDYWYHHLKAVADRRVPLLLVSALFRESQPFFKWYGKAFRKLLGFFTWLFVQDEASVTLLKSIGVTQASSNGDTRFDRVAGITQNPAPIPLLENFIRGATQVLVAGSTWPEDEALLHHLPWENEIKLIIAPHEFSNSRISTLKERFGKKVVTYTGLLATGTVPAESRVLIIDNFGMLSRLYRYGTIAYIGGGFNKSGIHNTLEAAAWGRPVLFGPNFKKFREAIGLIEVKAAYSVATSTELKNKYTQLAQEPGVLSNAGAKAATYVAQNIGATTRIIAFIQEKRLLTRL